MTIKWVPNPNDSIDLTKRSLSLATTEDINNMNLMISLIKMSKAYTLEASELHHSKRIPLRDFEKLFRRELIKRQKFTRIFTHQLKSYIDNLKDELSDLEKAQYMTDEQVLRAGREKKQFNENMRNEFKDLNAKLRKEGLEEITDTSDILINEHSQNQQENGGL